MKKIELEQRVILTLIAQYPKTECFTHELAGDDNCLLSMGRMHHVIDMLVAKGLLNSETKLLSTKPESSNKPGFHKWPSRFVTLTDDGKQWLLDHV